MAHSAPAEALQTPSPGQFGGFQALARPRSATGMWTGAAGVAATLVAIVLLRDWPAPAWLKALAVLGGVAATMVLVEVVIYRTHLNPTTGLCRQAVRPIDFPRAAQKLVGFWLTIGALAAAYGLLPPLATEYFAPFRAAALWCLPALVVFSPFYIALVDQRQREPVDAYALIAILLGGTRPADWRPLQLHARGWVVKGFFLPLMFVYVSNDLAGLWSGPLLPPAGDFARFFSWTIDLLYLLDVLLATIAYTLTLRIIDTQIRSVELTAGGWIACLACYPPFHDVTGRFLPFDQDGLFWGQIFAPYPAAYALWGGVILCLVFIYAWSTAAFGLRFSNLTNRGIITNGPYRWSKHPAYITKNLSWWMISMPFVAGAGWATAVQSCLLLAGVNLIYFLRARTEERHLSQDPDYRDYAAFIANEGLLARLIGRRRLTLSWAGRAGREARATLKLAR